MLKTYQFHDFQRYRYLITLLLKLIRETTSIKKSQEHLMKFQKQIRNEFREH